MSKAMTDREWKKMIEEAHQSIEAAGKQRQRWKQGVEDALECLATNLQTAITTIDNALDSLTKRIEELEAKSHGP